jgi:hypothetical protein
MDNVISLYFSQSDYMKGRLLHYLKSASHHVAGNAAVVLKRFHLDCRVDLGEIVVGKQTLATLERHVLDCVGAER